MAAKPCLDCQRLSQHTRCPECRAARQRTTDRARGTTAHRGYGSGWQRLVAAAIAEQERAHGVAWCLDCGVTKPEAKAAGNVLTGDHLRWPALTTADVEVCCRRCNSARGARRKINDHGPAIG